MIAHTWARRSSRFSHTVAGAVLSLFISCSVAGQSTAHHDKQFWKSIADHQYQVPKGESPASLIEDLTDNLGSPDPELRDDLVYGISAVWIYRDGLLSGDQLRTLARKCENNLTVGIGEQGSDTVLLRSFSALELSLIAAFDNKKPFLTDADFSGLLNAGLRYFKSERDLRGYDAEKGWMHATAHTADLLKFLARSPRLKTTDQPEILEAIGAKLRQDGHTFVFGENERMAAAVLSLVRRNDFDQPNFQSWLNGLAAESDSLWSAQKLNLDRFASVQNAKDLLRTLVVQIDLLDSASPTVKTTESSILATLKRMR
jgi:hypothetical protein